MTSIEAGKFYLVGTQFQETGNSDGMIKLADLVSLKNIPASTFSLRLSDAPTIMVRNALGNYTYYYYISDANGQSGPVWATGKNKATATIKVGTGFWFKAPHVLEGATATFAGEVHDSPSLDIAVGSQEYQLVSNPYPTDLTWDMISTSGLIPGTFSTRLTAAPAIMVRNALGNYTYFYYISDANGQSGPVWATGKNKATGKVCDVNSSIWVKSSSNGTLTISMDK